MKIKSGENTKWRVRKLDREENKICKYKVKGETLPFFEEIKFFLCYSFSNKSANIRCRVVIRTYEITSNEKKDEHKMRKTTNIKWEKRLIK
jgi:hypothetical protein